MQLLHSLSAIRSANSESGTLAYAYDANGKVTEKTEPQAERGGHGAKSGRANASVYWPGADGTILTKIDTAGNTTDQYVYFNGQLAVWLHSNLSTHYF